MPVPNEFTAGTTIVAEEVNENFENLDGRVTTIETGGATDVELAAAVSTLNTAIAAKQNASTAATDTELAALDAEVDAAVATLEAAIAAKQDASTAATDAELASAVSTLNTALSGKQATSEKGQANGYASLDGSGKVPSSQLADTIGSSVGTPNTQTTNYTLVLGDAGKVVEVNNASSRTVTVPNETDVPFPVGTIIGIDRIGAGSVTLVADTGVTIHSEGDGLAIISRYGSVTLRKRATNEWVAVGDLVAASGAGGAVQQRFVSGYYHRPLAISANIGAFTPTQDYAYVQPWWLPAGAAFQDIAVELAAAITGGNAQLFVVRQGSTGLPNGGTVLVNQNVATTSSGRRAVTNAWTVPANDLYWIGVIFRAAVGSNSNYKVIPLPLHGFVDATATYANQVLRGTHASFSSGSITDPFPTVSWSGVDSSPLLYMRAA